MGNAEYMGTQFTAIHHHVRESLEENFLRKFSTA